MKKILLIIDAQNDFITGSLKVSSAIDKMHELAEYIHENGNNYDLIILTQDWHPDNHMSFNTWPKHCVQCTNGSEIFKPIIDVINNYNHLILKKGDNPNIEEYSILQNSKSYDILSKIFVEDAKIDICGIAGDICVLNTINDLITFGLKDNLVVLNKYTASINENNFFDFLKTNKINYDSI